MRGRPHLSPAARRFLILLAIAGGSTLALIAWSDAGIHWWGAPRHHRYFDTWPDRDFYERWFADVPLVVGGLVAVAMAGWIIFRTIQDRWSVSWLGFLPLLFVNWWILFASIASIFASVSV